MQAAFYATPILYPLALVFSQSALAAKIIMLNPIAQIIQDVRYVLITPETQTISDVFGFAWARLIPIGIVLLLILISAWYFKSRSKYFAEEV